MKFIFIKEAELKEYRVLYNVDNRIYEFWNNIYSTLPEEVRNPISFSKVELVPITKHSWDITGVLPYTFNVPEISSDANKRLQNFIIFVEHETDEIRKWKENIRLQFAR